MNDDLALKWPPRQISQRLRTDFPGDDTMRVAHETIYQALCALALRLGDLDTTYCRIVLREKLGTERWQPISPTITSAPADPFR